MSDSIRMPAVIVPEEHQSAPRQHPADRAIQQAAEEIDSGHWVNDAGDEQARMAGGLGLALGLGQEAAATGAKPALEDFQRTNEINAALAAHPRVAEAMERMKAEARETDPRRGHVLIEKNCAMREMVEAAEQKNRWDGQGRWLGWENEESRYGQVLTPQQFYDRLGKVVGKGRLKLSESIVYPADHRRSGLSGMMVRNPLWNGQEATYREGRRKEAVAMADDCQRKWVAAGTLRRMGRTDEADKLLKEIATLAAEAKQMYEQANYDEMRAEPEFLRVATVQWPCSTEWMVMDFTEWGTVYKPRFYGWRTALLTMIRCGAITEAEAHKAFPVGAGPAGQWYLEQIYNFNLEGAVQ